MLRIVLSSLGALWVLSGIMTVRVAATTPPENDDHEEDKDAVLSDGAVAWVLIAWSMIGVLLMGPFGLFYAAHLKEERLRAIRLAEAKSKWMGLGADKLKKKES